MRLFYIIMIFVCLNKIQSSRRFKRDNQKAYQVDVFGATGRFTCDHLCIAKIENFTVTENNAKCGNEYLEITIDRTGECDKKLINGSELFFLTPNGICLEKEQKILSACPRIKR